MNPNVVLAISSWLFDLGIKIVSFDPSTDIMYVHVEHRDRDQQAIEELMRYVRVTLTLAYLFHGSLLLNIVIRYKVVAAIS